VQQAQVQQAQAQQAQGARQHGRGNAAAGAQVDPADAAAVIVALLRLWQIKVFPAGAAAASAHVPL